jgi:hypothetical protein
LLDGVEPLPRVQSNVSVVRSAHMLQYEPFSLASSKLQEPEASGAPVGDSVDSIVGDPVVGDTVDGCAVVGEVVGDPVAVTVVGDPVVGESVVGDPVVGCAVGEAVVGEEVVG